MAELLRFCGACSKGHGVNQRDRKVRLRDVLFYLGPSMECRALRDDCANNHLTCQSTDANQKRFCHALAHIELSTTSSIDRV